MAKRSASSSSRPSGPWQPTGKERILVFQGPDAFLRSEYTAALRALLTEHHGEIDILRFDGQSASAADVLDECRSFGLMQQHKIVLVDQADQLVKEDTRPLLERYAASPSENATLVLRSEKWNRGKLDDLIKKVGDVVRCEAFGEAECIKWITTRASGVHGAVIEPQAARALVERMNRDLGRIDSELAKLATMLSGGGGKPRIQLEHVVEQTSKVSLDNPWSITGPLVQGDPQRAVAHLQRLLGDNSKDLAVPINWAMMDLAGKIHSACCMIHEGHHPAQIAQALNIWDRAQADCIIRIARSHTPVQTLDLYRFCVLGDQAIKSGLGRPEDRIQRQALRFASLRA